MRNFFNPLQVVKTKKGYTVFTTVMVMIFSVLVFLDAAKSEVVIAADGDVQTVKTNTETVGELLKDLGIDVEESDELSHGENTEIVDGMEIRFETAHDVLLTIDGETEEYKTTAVTVGQFFQDEELEFSRYDDISHSNIAILDDDIEIEVTSAVPVKLDDGGETEKVWTTEDTVEDLLEKEDIEYKEQDRIKPDLDEEVEEDMKVKVTYVETEEVEKEETLSYDVEKKKDSSLAEGKEKTKTDGEDGKVLKTFEITKENGEEVSREKIDEEVLEDSTDKVIAVGTKEPKSTSSNDKKPKKESSDSSSSSSSGKSMTMEATAYGPDCVGCSGTSATGMDLTGGAKVIAVDPSVIPLGSRVKVEGYGEAIAGDTGGDIQGNRIDVLYPSESEAGSWGRRTVEVEVLD